MDLFFSSDKTELKKKLEKQNSETKPCMLGKNKSMLNGQEYEDLWVKESRK
jgi:hypothetical protein